MSKPHLYKYHGYWVCRIFRRGRRSGILFRLTHFGATPAEAYARLDNWAGLS